MAERAIDEVGGDGGASLVTEPTLAEIKEAAAQVATEAKQLIETCRSATDTTRFCKWDGQSPDGLKHKAYNSEEEPEPFEGASDMRVRTADMLINEDVVLLVTAAMRAQLNFKGTESNDSAQAGKMAILMRWVIRNYWGTRWIKELLKLANYYVGDSPALALLGVYWRQETALKTEQLTAQKLMDMYLENVMEVLVEQTEASSTDDLMAQAEQAASDFMVALNDKEFGEEILAAKLIEYFPGIRRARAKKVIRELRERGQAEFPVPHMRKNGPEVSAKRFLEDWFIPINTAEFQDARIYFEAEWLSKPEIIERKISEGWSDTFIEQVIGKPDSTGKRVGGHEGSAAFPDYVHGTDGVLRARTAEEYKGLYQILTAYYKATNEDGVPGRYYVVFHADADVAATERKLIDYAHGGYPGHAFQREVLTSRLCDTRGLAELAGPYQGLMKVYCDSFGDHAQIAGVPPIITRNRQRLGALHIRPLVELQAKRDGDYAWMKPPEYPRTVIDMIKELRRQTDEYFGRTNPDVAQDVVQLQREFKVLWWLMNLREALGQVWKLCQQYMPDEMITRITNAQGEPLFKSREEIQGQFDLELQFDPRDLDPEYLKTVAGIVKDILLAMDRDKTIRTAPIVSALLWRLAPELADASLVNVDEAAAKEREAEIEAYLQIRAGTEPELPDDGSINYEVRLALYQEKQQVNPAIFQDMAEDKMLILESRLQRMQVLAQQYGANVEIGRQGGRRALSGGAGSGRSGES
jgi:hypothetical protein